jgi:hypothetical protein
MPLTKAMLRYVIEFLLAMAFYVVVLTISLDLLRARAVPHGWMRTAVAVAPVVPTALVLLTIVRVILRFDELQRRIQIEAAALAALSTALLGMTYTFLENVGMPRPSGSWAFCSILFFWGLFVWILNWRYR